MKTTTNPLIAALAMLLFCSAASADEGPLYTSLALGRFYPDSSDAFVGKLDDGLAAELRFGYRPIPWGALELGAAGYRAERDLPPVDVTETTLRNLKTTALRFTFKGMLPLADGRFTLFAGAGYGRYWVKIDYKDPPSTDHSGSDAYDGKHLVAGGTWRMTAHTALGLEYERLSQGPDNVGPLGPQDPDIQFGGYMARLALEYRW